MMKLGMTELLQQAQKMQQNFKQAQEVLEKKTVEASAGGGMVKVVANGKQHIVSISIEPDVLKMEDKGMLQDLVLAGVNQALKASQEMAAEEMKGLTGGLGPLGSMLKGFS